MIIILEGCDKVGKSTLARSLVKNHHAKLIHTSAPKTKRPFNEYVETINSLNPSKNYVFDRLYLGELAYGEVYRHKSGLNKTQQLYLELMLLKFNPTLVRCWLDYNELTWNFHQEKEESTRIEDVPKLDKLFKSAFARSILSRVEYNYKINNGISPATNKTLKLGFSYIGYPNPDVLFVGDEPNYRRHLVQNIPYSVFNSTSGFFLIEALRNNKKKFGIVNSKEGHWLLNQKDVESINPKQVVCLGLNSLKRVSKLGFELRLVKHPQFAKRFYGQNSIKRYSDELNNGGEYVS